MTCHCNDNITACDEKIAVHNDVYIDRYHEKLKGRNGTLSHKIIIAFDILWFPFFQNRTLHLNVKSRVAGCVKKIVRL